MQNTITESDILCRFERLEDTRRKRRSNADNVSVLFTSAVRIDERELASQMQSIKTPAGMPLDTKRNEND